MLNMLRYYYSDSKVNVDLYSTLSWSHL